MPRSLFLRPIAVLCVTLSALTVARPAPAQTQAPPARSEAEQNVVNLPTTQPMPAHGHHFRITHRFARDWHRGTFGQLAEDLFGLDSGAIIGLDYRFAPWSRVQTGIYRSMLFKTIQVSGRVDAMPQSESLPVALSFLASVEGTNNMQDDHAPALGLVASRAFGDAVTLYASPVFVWNASAVHEIEGSPVPSPLDDGHEHTLFVGLGARVRVGNRMFIVGEFSPRAAGHSPGRGIWGGAFEKQTLGHVFQVNFTNSFGTTYGQIAGGGDTHNVYLGFNIARRF
jgi:hypothetical protein